MKNDDDGVKGSQLTKDSNFEYQLIEKGDVWIRVRNLDVKIVDTGEGVSVDIYPINSLDDAIAGAWATFSEAENDGSPQSEQ
jgi:hypothetical protein